MNEMSNMIVQIAEIIYYLRIQNYHEGSLRFRSMLGRLEQMEVLTQDLQDTSSILRQVLQQLLEALEGDDMVLLADLLEEGFLPVLKNYLVLGNMEVMGKYCLEATSSGLMTVRNCVSKLYLHSNCNPMEEARVLVQRVYKPECERYAVWGCGLGYHVRQLYEAARGAIDLTVFDEQSEIFEIAKQVGILDGIPAERLHFVTDASGRQFAECLMQKQTGIFLHFPSIKSIENDGLRKAIHSFFTSWNGTVQYEQELAINFRSNIAYCSGNVDDIRGAFQGAEVVLVGGGPSLDWQIDFLRDAKRDMGQSLEKKYIVVATTVLKKLLELGIEPDYTVVMDSQKRTIGQIAGVEECTVPMIVDSTAYWEFAYKYAGKKYIAYQKEYRLAEEAARREGRELYETGGSVTTLALDILLRFGVKSIYLVGVDLAYPDGISHATGTMDRKKQDITGMEMVDSVTGGKVPADTLFVGYRKWIERKLQEYQSVKVYNLSSMGAMIEGTIPYI
ncbi:MAG: DUF115 domain-containing protein [Lachnospiraceae bacterium]|nr:DUF115 domain-containing protein [Lachnospiraceae bacterium]